MLSTKGMIQKSPGPRSPVNFPSRSTTARSHWRAIFGDWDRRKPSSTPTIALIGFRVTRVASAPSPTGTINARAAIKFTRGAFSADKLFRLSVNWMLAMLLHLLLASAVQMINYVVQRKAARSGFRDEMIRELAQMLFAIAAAER